jgi:glycosyltransferase involved in cell wall biosynthesis
LRFTTSYHTRFPEYVAARMPIQTDWTYGFLRWFHAPAEATLVPTASLQEELSARHFGHVRLWTRGVDHAGFAPGAKTEFAGLPGPHLLYVGRVSVEKNVEAFLALDVPGTKIVVGDGPARAELAAKYPDAVFLGLRTGPELAALYRSADVFVFPSRTDTFGLVNIEALACGVPVAGFPVPGPLDIIGPDGRGVHGGHKRIGALDDDLAAAVRLALSGDRAAAIAEARNYSWDRCTDLFEAGLAGEDPPHPAVRAAA